MVQFTWSPRKNPYNSVKAPKSYNMRNVTCSTTKSIPQPQRHHQHSPSNKALRLLELQVQHVQELQNDVLEAHPKQAAGRFPVYHAARFSDIQSGKTSSSIIKLLMLMWTSWNMLEPLHESSWHRKTTHQCTSCSCMWLLILRANDIHYKKISPRISLQNVDTCGYHFDLSSSHV